MEFGMLLRSAVYSMLSMGLGTPILGCRIVFAPFTIPYPDSAISFVYRCSERTGPRRISTEVSIVSNRGIEHHTEAATAA